MAADQCASGLFYINEGEKELEQGCLSLKKSHKHAMFARDSE